MSGALKAGDTFGDYKVVRRLGKGGMGEVWLLQSASGGLVAAKILDPETAADHEARRRFLREAQLALGVKNPNLVEAYDVGIDPGSGRCYILMEYVPGGTLADRIKAHGALPIEEAVSIVRAMASVLELGRQKGIVHRDIKPANIMFASDGTPKLADLGIARAGAADAEATTVTQTGAMIGTPAYMSPEQMLDSHNVDTRADIYSLGVVFYEMLTGERPNKDDTALQLMARAIKGDPLPDVRTIRPEVSASLAQLLNMMVAPKREGRIATPDQITSAIDIIKGGGVFSPPRPLKNCGVSVSNSQCRKSRKQNFRGRFQIRDAFLCAVAAMALIAAGVAALSLLRGRPQDVSVADTGHEQESCLFRKYGPYGISLTADAGCEKGAENIYRKLVDVYLPTAVRYYGYPASNRLPKRVVPIRISRDAKNPNNLVLRSSSGFLSWKINLAEQSDDYTGRLDNLTSSILCVCEEPSESMFRSYVDALVMADIAKRERSQSIKILVEENPQIGDGGKRVAYLENRAKWYSAYETVRTKCPDFISRYSRLKNECFTSGKIKSKITVSQMVRLMEESSGVSVEEIFRRMGVWPDKRSCRMAPLVQTNTIDASVSSVTNGSIGMTGPYGMRFYAAAGCEKGAMGVLDKLTNNYLPVAVKYYGDPFALGVAPRVFSVVVKRNGGRSSNEPPSYGDGRESWTVYLASQYDDYDVALDRMASTVLTVCSEPPRAVFWYYVNKFVMGEVKRIDPVNAINSIIRLGRKASQDDENGKIHWAIGHGAMFEALEEIRNLCPDFILKYCNLKNKRFSEGKLPRDISLRQMADLLSEASGASVDAIFRQHRVYELIDSH